MAHETPAYEVVRRIGSVEIRDYEPYLVAETEVEGTLESAGNQGFRRLAGYIFGANDGGPDGDGDGAKIAMTAPVTQSAAGEGFRLQFMMPSGYTADSLPAPSDPRVEIRREDGKRMAAIGYSGRWTKGRYEGKLAELDRVLETKGLEPVGEPVWARYDPPFKPWFLRRNEVLIEIRP